MARRMSTIATQNSLDSPGLIRVCRVHLWFHFCRCISKQAVLLARRFKAEVFVGVCCSDAAALGAVKQAELHQIRFVNFLDGIFLFTERSRNRIESDRPAGIFLKNS